MFREIDRYGNTSIEICESIFCLDSDISISLTQLLLDDNKETEKWLAGIKGIDDYLTAFGLNLCEKLEFAEISKQGFFAEFNGNKVMQDRINRKYRQHKSAIMAVMLGSQSSVLSTPVDKLLRERYLLVEQQVKKIRVLKGNDKLMVNETNLISSLIHMMLNRLIGNKERAYEMVLYEFIYKYYLSLKARNSIVLSEHRIEETN